MANQLHANQQLNVNDHLDASDKTSRLIMQNDGNLVLYRSDDGRPIWASNTYRKPVNHAIMQGDGNFVCYDNSGHPFWATDTWGHPGAYIVLQDDGDLVVYGPNNTPLWASNTEENFSRTDTFGGNGGDAFDDSHDLAAWGPIRHVVVRHGSEIDSLGVSWANGNFSDHGGTGGTVDYIDLAADESILRVDGRSGDRLDQITFFSNKATYGPFGGRGGNPFSVNFRGMELLYLFGRSGAGIDQVGFGYGNRPQAVGVGPQLLANGRSYLGGTQWQMTTRVGLTRASGQVSGITSTSCGFPLGFHGGVMVIAVDDNDLPVPGGSTDVQRFGVDPIVGPANRTDPWQASVDPAKLSAATAISVVHTWSPDSFQAIFDKWKQQVKNIADLAQSAAGVAKLF
jgi:hypothetical protein